MSRDLVDVRSLLRFLAWAYVLFAVWRAVEFALDVTWWNALYVAIDVGAVVIFFSSARACTQTIDAMRDLIRVGEEAGLFKVTKRGRHLK